MHACIRTEIIYITVAQFVINVILPGGSWIKLGIINIELIEFTDNLYLVICIINESEHTGMQLIYILRL